MHNHRARALVLRLSPSLMLAVFGLVLLVAAWARASAGWVPVAPVLLDFMGRYVRGEPKALLIGIVLGPIVEELIFRRALLPGLLPFTGRAAATAGSAALFAAAHANVHQLLPAFILGLALGWVYVRTRALVLCILGHAWYNALWWLIPVVLGPWVPGGHLLPVVPGATEPLPITWVLAGFAATVVGFLRFRRVLALHGLAAEEPPPPAARPDTPVYASRS